MSGPKNALAGWSSSALRPVELPTGWRAIVRLPNVAALVAANAFPQDLRQLAAKYATSGIEVSKLEGDEIGRFVAFTYDLIARALRYMAPPDSEAWDAFQKSGADPEDEGWQHVSLTGPELAEMDVDQEDLDALGKIVGRQTSTNAVTYAARLERGLLTLQDAAKQADQARRTAESVAGGGGESLDQFATFRRRAGGAERGDDSGEVLDSTVGAARSAGSRRGAGGRRSGRD